MKLRPLNRNKKGAIELSVGTMVIIVVAVVMLVLALIFVKRIFSTATSSVDILDKKVTSKLQGLFGDEGRNVVVMLGSDKIARFKPSEETYGIAIGARTVDGSLIKSRDRLKFKLTLDTASSDCDINIVKNFFLTPLDTLLPFDEYEKDSAFSIVRLRIPAGAVLCTQKVFIDVEDTKPGATNPGGSQFTIEIIRSGFAFL
ncbi:hypothetical protein B6U80_01915 [Candidatus Pacearchaeota archaeon ex4484_26]|nr:MAG: hypothetical protein B6U80_01915 [Candidatus Pacearchaeota archaeon ex4484_26]